MHRKEKMDGLKSIFLYTVYAWLVKPTEISCTSPFNRPVREYVEGEYAKRQNEISPYSL